MLLANTIHSYPAFFIGGWFGILLSMVVEFSSLSYYLRRIRSSRWIFRRFVVANLLSALAGIPIFVTTYYPPSGTAKDNIQSLSMGVLIVFIVTILIEGSIFLRRTSTSEKVAILRSVIMSNFFSYASLVALHLYLV